MLSLQTVLGCGGRHYHDQRRVFEVIDDLGCCRIVHGAAPGADRLAGRWAVARRVPCKGYPAQWDRLGRAAGPLRNQQMLACEHVDLVVAFPGDKGTEDMLRRALKAGIDCLLVRR